MRTDPSPADLYDEPIPPDVLRPEGAPSADDLDRFFDYPLADDGQGLPEAQAWTVQNDDEAEWAMAHVAALDQERTALSVQADAWRERIAAWFEHRDSALGRRQSWFESHLLAYARRRREDDPRLKTLDLPSGKVRSRASSARVSVEDPDAFLRWADLAERVDLFRIERKPEISALRQALQVTNVGSEDAPDWRVLDPATGEEVPGLAVVPSETAYRVSPS